MNFMIILLLVQIIRESSFKSTTLSQKKRIHLLRQIINDNIKIKEKTNLRVIEEEEDAYIRNLNKNEYDNIPIFPITPKRHIRIDQIKSTKASTLSTVKVNAKRKGKNNSPRSHKSDMMKVIRMKTPQLIFYRRMYDTNILNEPTQWLHCQDMVTPFLTGVKKNLSTPKTLTTSDESVKRFLHLMTVNTTSYGREEIYSIMYQISKEKLRLFQWQIPAVGRLFKYIVKGRKHTFRNLKAGLKAMFAKWNMDFSNLTVLLQAARLFRPPCVKISTFDGSTKSGKASVYTKPTVATTGCFEDDDDCHDP